MMSRDLDSSIIDREAKAVEEWLQSDKDFHFMRDHPSKKNYISIIIVLCHWVFN